MATRPSIWLYLIYHYQEPHRPSIWLYFTIRSLAMMATRPSIWLYITIRSLTMMANRPSFGWVRTPAPGVLHGSGAPHHPSHDCQCGVRPGRAVSEPGERRGLGSGTGVFRQGARRGFKSLESGRD